MCEEANRDFEGFWARLARENVVWTKPFTRTLDESKAPFYRWFDDGELNASANCLDKHIGTPVENKTAIIFEADDGAVTRITYRELLARVSQFANALHAQGIRKGDRVIIYMPMAIESVIAMQACARIGATHSVVFGGFSAKALNERIIDAGAVAVITANLPDARRQGDAAESHRRREPRDGRLRMLRNVLVYMRTTTPCAMVAGRDKTFTEVLQGQGNECKPEPVNAEHPLFILYTSGSTGKPKGVQHSTGGYLLWAKLTMDWTFDIKPADVFWCTADIGWVTGHTYVRLRAACRRRDAGRVRRRSRLSECRPLLGDDPAAQGVGVLHGPDGDPLADQGSRRRRENSPEALRSDEPAHPGHGGRTDQPRSVDVVPPQCRRRALPDRRHVVADRNRRPHDLAAARSDADGSGLVHACLCQASWPRSWTRLVTIFRTAPAACWSSSALGRR